MSMNIKEINNCEVCDSNDLISVLNLGDLPMCDDLIPVGSDRECLNYPTEILFCESCKTAHQKYQIKKEILFNDSYHYRARFTLDVINGMKELVASTKSLIGELSKKKILDVGCNDGSLLDFFRNEGAETFGVEPTDAVLDAKEKKHVTYKEYLTPDISKKIINENGKMDIVSFTNVFAHIDDLRQLIHSVKLLLHKESTVVIENHYLGSILKNYQFDTFYHEHPRTYSLSSFMRIADSLNMKISKIEFPSRYGGNIRIFMRHKNIDENVCENIDIQSVLENEKTFSFLFQEMKKKIEIWKENKTNQINNLLENHNEILAKAFPGRAAILMKMLGLDYPKVLAVFEKSGSKKIGHYVPGTRIPILSDDDLFEKNNLNKPLMNLAWHIPEEIRSYLKENNFKGDVFEIINLNDW